MSKSYYISVSPVFKHRVSSFYIHGVHGQGSFCGFISVVAPFFLRKYLTQVLALPTLLFEHQNLAFSILKISGNFGKGKLGRGRGKGQGERRIFCFVITRLFWLF